MKLRRISSYKSQTKLAVLYQPSTRGLIHGSPSEIGPKLLKWSSSACSSVLKLSPPTKSFPSSEDMAKCKSYRANMRKLGKIVNVEVVRCLTPEDWELQGSQKGGLREINQTARDSGAEKAGTSKPERACPPFADRYGACPQHPIPPHPSFCMVAQAYKQPCISSFPAEQDGGGHVGRESRYRLSRGHSRHGPSPSLPAFLPFGCSTPASQMGDFPSSLGLALYGEAQAYVSAAATLPTLVTRPWRARKWGEVRPLRKPNAAYLDKPA